MFIYCLLIALAEVNNRMMQHTMLKSQLTWSSIDPLQYSAEVVWICIHLIAPALPSCSALILCLAWTFVRRHTSTNGQSRSIGSCTVVPQWCHISTPIIAMSFCLHITRRLSVGRLQRETYHVSGKAIQRVDTLKCEHQMTFLLFEFCLTTLCGINLL